MPSSKATLAAPHHAQPRRVGRTCVAVPVLLKHPDQPFDNIAQHYSSRSDVTLIDVQELIVETCRPYASGTCITPLPPQGTCKGQDAIAQSATVHSNFISGSKPSRLHPKCWMPGQAVELTASRARIRRTGHALCRSQLVMLVTDSLCDVAPCHAGSDPLSSLGVRTAPLSPEGFCKRIRDALVDCWVTGRVCALRLGPTSPDFCLECAPFHRSNHIVSRMARSTSEQ